ncbi:hypothetical protein [Rhizobium laguerreae]|uniref:hypothetical protein n=1 Tax=Rhizobium laguerreae TaxID=1076926 RepID=UPI001C8FAF8F|nr:hypothetical protein [Rhizobium laguerreae]MBY3048737.1 hypothetical protein [Rhizobium laguerreae]
MKTRRASQTAVTPLCRPDLASHEELDEVFLDAVDLQRLLEMCGLGHAVSDAQWSSVERMGPIVALVDPLTGWVEQYDFDASVRPH